MAKTLALADASFDAVFLLGIFLFSDRRGRLA